tara:strand:+ start:276 stop:710 length:435 start_codon:yes stop_codon:yes gene_type:complete
MLVYLPLFCIVVIFCISFNLHFLKSSKFNVMVAFIGNEHVRTFERQYDNVHADLWAFGHRKRKATRILFSSAEPFSIFEEYEYEHILLVEKTCHLPLFLDTTTVVEYKLENKTVATLWPRLSKMPPEAKNALDWYSGTVNIINL